MKKIYHIRPVMESFIWGGRKIIDKYHLDTNLENVGILYQVIALPGRQDNRVEETGSVAVEPSEAVSEKLFGNRARTLAEFKELVAAKDWDRLFQKAKVKEGDFLHTPAGVIHGGGGEGKMAMTFATNSDISYRFYDYGRNDPGRLLHLEQVYDCVNIPEVPLGPIRAEPVREHGLTLYRYYDEPGEYTARRIDVSGAGLYDRKEFYFLFCSDGSGTASGEAIRAGETLFIPAGYGPLELGGDKKLYLISYRNRDAV